MHRLEDFNLLHKGRRHHKHEMAKDPSVPALIAGAGEVSANGSLKVLYPAVDGSTVTYSAWPETVYRFGRAPTPKRPKAAAVPATPSPAELAKHHISALLDLACGLEGRIAAATHHFESESVKIAAE